MSEPLCELCCTLPSLKRGLEFHKMEICALVSAMRSKDKELAKLKAEVCALKAKCEGLAQSVEQLTKRVVEHRARTAQSDRLVLVHEKKVNARIAKLEEASDG